MSYFCWKTLPFVLVSILPFSDCQFRQPVRKPKIAIENGNRNLLTERASQSVNTWLALFPASRVFECLDVATHHFTDQTGN